MKKIKVALVIPTHFDVYSSLNNYLKVYRHLIRNKDIEVAIFTDKKNKVRYEGFKVVAINGLDYKTIFEKVLFILGIPRFYYTDLIEKLKGYDIIESSNPEFYMFAYQAYKAAKKYKAKLIYRTSQTVEGFFLFKLTKYFIVPVASKAYDYATALLFTNPKAKERCIKLGLIGKDSKKIVVTGHATDTKVFKPLNLKKDKSKTILLSVGGLYKIKGHHLIIKALRKVIDKGFNAELWIVGEGYYKDRLIRLARELDIENKVKLLGKKSHNELANIYNMSDIFVLANYQEITPAVNEAMACEKPVVAMECGGYDFVVPNENYGLIAKKFDAEDIANKVIFLMQNKGEAEKIAKNGRDRTLKNFSIEKIALKIYKSFTKNN